MRRYRRLLRYAWPYRGAWALLTVLTLLSTALALLQPWPLKVLIDSVLVAVPGTPGAELPFLPGATTREALLAWVVAAGLGIFLLNSAVDVILTFIWVGTGQRLVYDLARDLFAAVQRRSLLFHARTPVGDSLARITGDSWVAHTVVDSLLVAPARALITMTGAVLLMLRLDIGLTLLALAALPFLAASSGLLGRRVRLAARARRLRESHLQAHVQQILRSIPVVQAFAQEESEYRRLRVLAQRTIRAAQRATVTTRVYDLSTGLISALATAGILWFGTHRVLAGSLSLGSILVFLAYLALLQTQLKSLTGMYRALQGAGAGIERVSELLEEQAEVRDGPGARRLPRAGGHVQLEGVTFGYEPGRPVLHAVSLEIRPGETVALVGPSGAGKSTLAGLVPRFFDPWQGTVRLDGHDLRTLQIKSVRDQVALVLQEPFLFPLSVAENIGYARPSASRSDIETAARAANADAFIRALPDGYDTVLGQGGATLSGGERQRLAIARALLKDAPILILDEPTSALDAETEQLVLDALRRLMAGRTSLVIAHRLSTIRDADHIVLLEDGRISEVGTHDQLVHRGGRYARLNAIHAVTGGPLAELTYVTP